MNFLSIDQVSKTWHDNPVLKNVTMGIQKGEKVALVAANGQGKTTLLNIATGKESPDSGKAILRKDMNWSYLSQNNDVDPELTVIENILFDDLEINHVIRRYNEVLSLCEVEPQNPEYIKRLDAVSEEMNTLEAWDHESKVKQVLTKLKLDRFNQKASTLSGGQKKRIALAKVILSNADFLILDEPTNHLDLDMIEWLEQFLTQRDLTLLLVTHDRYFLDRVCNRIIELDRGDLFHYEGNFSYYIEKKAEREAQREREIEKDKNLYRRELEWVRRMPKARGTKSKSRIESFEVLEKRLKAQRQKTEVKIDVRTEYIGTKVIELHRISKNYGDLKILESFTYHFKRGEKVGIIGPNGAGKTTLLNLIAGLEEADSGKVVLGETVNLGYYKQETFQVEGSKKVIDVVTDIADWIPLSNGHKLTASQMLLQFGFSYDKQHDYVVKLSGGEKRRLFLLTILMKAPNFLILDEPTNDLDIETMSVLETFLQSYKGTLLVVSHDRYFMDRIVDHCFVSKGKGEWQHFPGNYSDYREYLDLQEQASREEESKSPKIQESNSSPSIKKEQNKKKRSYKEQYELDQIEKDIPQLKEKIQVIEENLNQQTTDFEKITELSEELGALKEELDQKEWRWLELNED